MDDHRAWIHAQYYALHTHFPPRRQGYFRVVCAWCQRHLRWQRVPQGGPVSTSHGICAACQETVEREFAARAPAAPDGQRDPGPCCGGPQ